MDREGVEPSNHRSHLPCLPPRRGCFAELSAIRPMDPGQGVEPRSPRSERGVLPVRRSRNVRAETASPSICRTPWEIDAAGERRPSGYGSSFSVSSGRSRTMFSMPLAYPSTLDRRPLIAQMLQRSPSCVEGLWSPSSGAASGKAHAKANAYSRRAFPARNAEVFLSQAGPRFDLALVQVEHHL